MTSEIINNQVKQLENLKLFKELEQKNRNCQYARKFYYNNREKIIKEKTEYSKHYEKAHFLLSNINFLWLMYIRKAKILHIQYFSMIIYF